MEDLVKLLASMQAELKAAEDAMNADSDIIAHREAVATARGRLEMSEMALANDLSYYKHAMEATKAHIEEIKAQVIDEWDGDKKTLKFDAGTLKFRTTQSLNIENETALLYNLIDHAGIKDVATKYISGFNKTAVKKYMDVHELPTVIAELISKTTVKLEMV